VTAIPDVQVNVVDAVDNVELTAGVISWAFCVAGCSAAKLASNCDPSVLSRKLRN
jgi:hypothetical protein